LEGSKEQERPRGSIQKNRVRPYMAAEPVRQRDVAAGNSSMTPLRVLPRWFGDLPESTVRRVLDHKAKKAPLSPLDHHVITPMGVAIAQRLPRSISPNAISLFGGGCAMASSALVVFGASRGSAGAHCMAGVFWFAYQLADVTDGAQARGTGQGTPLGGVVDHCTDAVVCVFGAIAAISVCDPKGLFRVLGIRTAVMLEVAFFAAPWAEYAGEDFDDRGVIEVNLITALSLALPGLLHIDVFLTQVNLSFLGPMPLGQGIMLCVFVFAVFQSISRLVLVLWHTQRPGLLTYFLPILMHWLAAEAFCHYMPQVSFDSWLVVQAMSFTGMSVTAMKMRLAATVVAPWSALHAEVIPPLCLAVLMAFGIPVGMLPFALVFAWQATVMALLWYDFVTRMCCLLDIPFLAPLPPKAS